MAAYYFDHIMPSHVEGGHPDQFQLVSSIPGSVQAAEAGLVGERSTFPRGRFLPKTSQSKTSNREFRDNIRDNQFKKIQETGLGRSYTNRATGTVMGKPIDGKTAWSRKAESRCVGCWWIRCSEDGDVAKPGFYDPRPELGVRRRMGMGLLSGHCGGA